MARWLAFAKAAGEALVTPGNTEFADELGQALLAGVAAAEAVETHECFNCGERVPPGCGGEFAADEECAMRSAPPAPALPVPGKDGCPEWAEWLAWSKLDERCGDAFYCASAPWPTTDQDWISGMATAAPAYDDPARAGTCVRLKNNCGGVEGHATEPRPGARAGVPSVGGEGEPNPGAGVEPGPQSPPALPPRPICITTQTRDGGPSEAVTPLGAALALHDALRVALEENARLRGEVAGARGRLRVEDER